MYDLIRSKDILSCLYKTSNAYNPNLLGIIQTHIIPYHTILYSTKVQFSYPYVNINLIIYPFFSFLHLITKMNTRRHSALPQHSLESRNLIQGRGALDEILQALLLLLGELDPGHARSQTRAVLVARDGGVERRLGLDVHDLLRQLRGRIGRAE